MRSVHRSLPWIVSFALLCALPYLAQNQYQIFLMNLIAIMIILVVGLNIVKGFAGQVTVGHIGLYAVGAYSTAVITVNFGFPFLLALPCAILITMMAGCVVGVPSFRLEGAYLALATLGFAESIRISAAVTDYLGSTSGFGGIPSPVIFGVKFDQYHEYYYIVMPIALVAVYISFAVLRSSTGRAFTAIREDTIAAAAAGVNVKRYKLIAFVVGAAYAGCAGSLYAQMTPGYIHPNNFTVIEMVTLLLMVVLGGLGHIWGGIIGAVLVTIIFDLTRGWYYYQLLMFGSVIVLSVIFMPKGIGGILDRYLISKRFVTARERSHNISVGSVE
ncbi:MAG: branched-chain amino acid ABC transporter permease [Hyphomicrobiales bacterium]|nr:branched-chain amino acid ABC transporter permease [Hyphomicrobiales bacterium]